jgi:hypothetical protein
MLFWNTNIIPQLLVFLEELFLCFICQSVSLEHGHFAAVIKIFKMDVVRFSVACKYNSETISDTELTIFFYFIVDILLQRSKNVLQQ